MAIRNTTRRATSTPAVVAVDPDKLSHLDKAKYFAGKFSAEASALVEAGLDRKEQNNQAPVFLVAQLEEDFNEYDKDGNLVKDVLGTFPRPGSETGNNPDKFKKPGKDADGAYKDIPTVWWNELADATALSQVHAKVLKDCKESTTGKAGPYANLDELQLSTKKNRATQAINYHRSAIKRAAALYFQRADLLDMGGIGFEFIMDVNPDTKEEEPTRAAKNIYIFNEKKRSEFKLISVGAFLAYDIAEAKKNGGKWSDLLATARKESDSDDSDTAGDSEIAPIKGTGTFEEYIGETAGFCEEMHGDPKRKDFNQIVHQLNGAGSDDYLFSLMTVSKTLLAIIAKVHRAEQRFEAIANAETEEAEAE